MSKRYPLSWQRSTEALAMTALLWSTIGLDLPLQAQSLSGSATISLSPRFSPDPMNAQGVGGGSVAAIEIAGQSDTSTGGCLGYVNSQPNHTLTLKAFFNYLKVQVQSSEDSTIVVRGPGGIWCNDDFQDRDAGIDGEWLPGTYQIWVGTYHKDKAVPYTLRITEVR